jgi:hypothetical protein
LADLGEVSAGSQPLGEVRDGRHWRP